MIPTPILAKTSRRASATAATIQTMLYNGFSNKRAGIIKQYNTSLLRTAIFMSRNSSLLQCIAELLQGASIKISIAETINSVIAAAIVEDCSRSIRYKQAYVSTGNCKVLLDYEAQDWLFGAYSDNLLILYFENGSFTYRSYSLSEGTLTDIYSYDYQDGSPNTIARPVDNFLYIFEPQESGSAKVICLNMETKSTADLNLSVPYFGTDATTIGSPFDDYLYVTTHDFNSSSTVSYLINRITGEYSPITLSYMQGAISVGVEVIASTSEYYLVNTGITPVPIMLTSNDGSQYQSEIDMVSYSLIKKDDYLSNTPAYIPITNQFTA